MSPSPPATPTRGRPILTVDRAGCAPLLSLEVDRGRPDRLWYRSAVVDPPLGAGIRDGGGCPDASRRSHAVTTGRDRDNQQPVSSPSPARGRKRSSVPATPGSARECRGRSIRTARP